MRTRHQHIGNKLQERCSMKVRPCIAHPRHPTWWRRCCTQGSLVQSTWWGTWPQHGQCKCHRSSTCSAQSLQPSQHDSPRLGSSSLQDPWERTVKQAEESETEEEEVGKQETLDYFGIWGGQTRGQTKLDYPLTCVWSSFSPGIPWQRRSVWPCTAAPQHSPPPCHNLSSSPAGSRVAYTLWRCRTEAPACTHLWEWVTVKINADANSH